MKTKTAITWKRGVRAKLGGMNWHSHCGLYMVHKADFVDGVKISPVYYTSWMREQVKDWIVEGRRKDVAIIYVKLSKHRSKAAAIKACEKHARRPR